MFSSASVAITYFNSSKFIQDAIYLPLMDDRFREVVIYNDGSSRSETKFLQNLVNDLSNGKPLKVYEDRKNGYFEGANEYELNVDYSISARIRSGFEVNVGSNWKKLKIVNAKQNLGSYVAKYEAVKNSTSDWALLLDSDNHLIESGIDGLFAVSDISDDEMYVPNVCIMNRHGAYPWDFWNFRAFGYQPLDSTQLRSMFTRPEFGDEKISHLLNNGNMLMKKEQYLSASNAGMKFKDLVSAKESCLLYASWLASGNKIRVVPGYIYFHRLHGESLWMVKLDEHKPSDLEILNYF
jgi:glycosyltransferase involved in cell wall biosynthesis